METNNLKLIDGIFTAEDAKKVLFKIINNKINHHKLDDFSNKVRFDSAENSSKNRVNELELTLIEIEKIIEFAKVNNMKLKINSDINIEFIK